MPLYDLASGLLINGTVSYMIEKRSIRVVRSDLPGDAHFASDGMDGGVPGADLACGRTNAVPGRERRLYSHDLVGWHLWAARSPCRSWCPARVP